MFWQSHLTTTTTTTTAAAAAAAAAATTTTATTTTNNGIHIQPLSYSLGAVQWKTASINYTHLKFVTFRQTYACTRVRTHARTLTHTRKQHTHTHQSEIINSRRYMHNDNNNNDL